MSNFITDPKHNKDGTSNYGDDLKGHTHKPIHDESEGSEFLDEGLRMKEQPLEYRETNEEE